MDEISKLETIRHSASHVLAQAVIRIFPNAKLGIGPATQDGFYYDFEIPNFIEMAYEFNYAQQSKLLEEIQLQAQDIISSELSFTQVIVDKDEASNILLQNGQIYKSELLQFVDEDEVSFYKTGEEFIDLCRGPHVSNTGKIKYFKLTHINKANWLGDENRPILLRIHGVAFSSSLDAEQYELNEKRKLERDHRKLGNKINLFYNNQSQGTNKSMLLENGAAIKRKLISFFTEQADELDVETIEPNFYWNKNTFINHELAGYYDKIDITSIDKDLYLLNKASIQLLDYVNSQKGDEFKHTNFLYTSNTINPSLNPNLQFGLYKELSFDSLRMFLVCEEHELTETMRKLINYIILTYKQILPGNYSTKNFSTDENLYKYTSELVFENQINHQKAKSDLFFNLLLEYSGIYGQNHLLSEIKINKNFSEYISINKKLVSIEVDIIANIQKLIALIIENSETHISMRITPYHVAIIPSKEETHNYSKSISHKLRDYGYDVKEYANFNISEKKRIEIATSYKFPFILKVGNNEEKTDTMYVIDSTQKEIGLMKIEEFLQKLDT